MTLRQTLPRFGASGMIITVCSYGVTGLGLLVGLSISASIAIGYVCSSILGYYLHSLLSFRKSLKGTLAPIKSVALVYIIGAILTYVGSRFTVYIVGKGLISLTLSAILPVFINYTLWRLIAVKD